MPACPTCQQDLPPVLDLPRRRGLLLYVCACGELCQELEDGVVIPIANALSAHAKGDDRIRAAVSRPHATTATSFLEAYESMARLFTFELGANVGLLRTILSRAAQRLDYAIGVFSVASFVDDAGAEALRALQEVRDLLSALPPRNRGVRIERPPE